jgi:hypothetical protein
MSLLEGSKTIGGLKLRPFTLGSFEACEKLGLTLFVGNNGGQVSNEEAMRQMIAFAWVQSTPPEVLVDTFSAGTQNRAIELFKWGLDLRSIDAIAAEVQRIGEAIKSTAVEVQAKPQKGNEETPPPN